jgi:hypothetical protein
VSSDHDSRLALNPAQNGFELECFHVWQIEYPPGGMSPEELAKIRALIVGLQAHVSPPAQTLHFAFPGNINPDAWKAITRAHAPGWEWSTGYAYRMDQLPAPAKPTASKRYLSSLMKAFPEQAQKLSQAIADSEGSRPDLTHRFAKTSSYERLFRDRPWVSPAEVLAGTGGFAMFCVNDVDTFFCDAAVLTGRAGSMSTQGMSFLIPVFTKDALAIASRETLRAWFDLFELYAVEYGYSQGLLIASRSDLSALVKEQFRENVPPEP